MTKTWVVCHVPPTYSPKYLECLRVYSVPQKDTTTKHREYTAHAAKTTAPWDIVILCLHGTTFYILLSLL
jgi:hypothetical protein